MRDYKDNGITHIFNAKGNGLELITMFETGYPNFNISNDVYS